jgi:hypothetical protein
MLHVWKLPPLLFITVCDKRVADLEEINLNYLSIIEQMSDSLGILTGEVLQEVEKQEKVENLLSLPSSKKGNYEN